MSFAGKSAFVTGAGGGMGFAIAEGLLAEGCNVTLFDLKPKPSGLEAARASAHYVQGDLTDEPAVKKAVLDAFARHKRLDYLVNAAGVLWFTRDRSLVDIDLDVWDEVLAINLKSMVQTCRHAVPLMKKSGGGAMVHISSIQCLRGDDHPQDAYQASKAGMVALSKSLAIQFAADKIRSNLIFPGPTLTPMQQRWYDDPAKGETVAKFVPLGRLGTAEDIANAALFLLSDKASWITGTELIVDGGLLARP
ncbi:MAG TPA: SDR family NAD(P)-dependent oxidoreductase [Alphaproteobacteria bacterium]|nr:SDR family NAD(P)-dependent oxidoreductase [Alphaproteobacteria bacterium]